MEQWTIDKLRYSSLHAISLSPVFWKPREFSSCSSGSLKSSSISRRSKEGAGERCCGGLLQQGACVLQQLVSTLESIGWVELIIHLLSFSTCVTLP